jgi:hypothetical protein
LVVGASVIGTRQDVVSLDDELEPFDIDALLAARVGMQGACEATIGRLDLPAGCLRAYFELCVPVGLRLPSGCHLVDLRE